MKAYLVNIDILMDKALQLIEAGVNYVFRQYSNRCRTYNRRV